MARTKPYSRRSSYFRFIPEVRPSAASSAPSYTHAALSTIKRPVVFQITSPSFFHSTSCSMLSNRSSSKKSRTVIFSPEHIFEIVTSVGLLLPVLIMLFNVDCVSPASRASLLIVMWLISHKSRIRFRTASLMFKRYNTFTHVL